MPSSAARVALLALVLGTAQPMLTACTPDPAAANAPTRYVATATGRLDARVEARFLAAERDGRIAAMLVRPGDSVAAGDALLQIACADLAAQQSGAKARADAAAAQARLIVAGPRAETLTEGRARAREMTARRTDAADLLARAEALQASGFVSTRHLTELRADLVAAEAQSAATDAALATLLNGARSDERRAAQAQAAGAEADAKAIAEQLDKCTLRSPIAGTVLKVMRREGEFTAASAGTPLVVVGDTSTMIVRTEVVDRDAAAVAIGQRAEIWLDGGDRRWAGHVVEASNLMGRRTARSLDPAERFDRDVREVLVAFDSAAPPSLVGLRVNVGLLR